MKNALKDYCEKTKTVYFKDIFKFISCKMKTYSRQFAEIWWSFNGAHHDHDYWEMHNINCIAKPWERLPKRMAQKPIDWTTIIVGTSENDVTQSDRPCDAAQCIIDTVFESSMWRAPLCKWIIRKYHGCHQHQRQSPCEKIEHLSNKISKNLIKELQSCTCNRITYSWDSNGLFPCFVK